MILLAYVIAAGAGVGLIASGGYYHVNRRKLNSDPVLIAACYLLGGFYIAACLL